MKVGGTGGKSGTGSLGDAAGTHGVSELTAQHPKGPAKKGKSAVKKQAKVADDPKGRRFRSLETKQDVAQPSLDVREPLMSGRPGFTNPVRR